VGGYIPTLTETEQRQEFLHGLVGSEESRGEWNGSADEGLAWPKIERNVVMKKSAGWSSGWSATCSTF
jgi:hypothetical protein